MKSILFLIEGGDKKKIKKMEGKIKEIMHNKSIDYDIIPISHTDQQLYHTNLEVLNVPNVPQYVCLLHEEMVISDDMIRFYTEYFNEEEEALYLPLVVLENKKVKGVLNNCLWNSNLVMEEGYLDHTLALKQMDTTLYGALIPYHAFVNENFYNDEVYYYQHFCFLNKYTKEENIVVGIPKILCTISIDLSFEGVETDVKITHFKLAKEMKTENNLKIV